MIPILSRKRLLLAGAIAVVTAGAAGGTVLATRSTAASPSASSNAPNTPSPSPSPGVVHPHRGLGHHRARHLELIIGRVTAVSASSISLADSHGTVTTYTLASHVRVVGPDHQPESLQSIPVGEIVVAVEATHHTSHHLGSPEATPGAGRTTEAQVVVVAIRDSGFRIS